MQLVGDRQTDQVCDERAVKRRQQGDRHEGTEFRRVRHVREHLHHAEQRADHAERRRAVADGAIDLRPLVQVHQKIVAIALHVVADEFEIVTVGDVADSLGEKRLVGLDLLQADRPLLAGDFRDAGQFVDQIARRKTAHGEGEFCTQRHAVQDRAERKSYQCRRRRAAEDDDDGMDVVEHPEVTAHQDQRRQDDGAGDQAKERSDIHSELRRVRELPAILTGRAAHPERRRRHPTTAPLMTRKG